MYTVRRQVLALVFTSGVLACALGPPPAAVAKTYIYALTWGGGLVKYDPDADQVTQVNPYAGQGVITERDADSVAGAPTRILDVSRGRIATFTEGRSPGVALLDLRAGRTTPISVGPPESIAELSYFVYPRQASRFYVQWLQRLPGGGPEEPMLTAVDLTGKVLGTSPSMIPNITGSAVPRPDGRSFYVRSHPNTVLLVDAEALAITGRYDLSPFGGRAPVGTFGIGDIRDDRVIMGGREGIRSDQRDPRILFTVDLRTLTATPRFHTGVGAIGGLLLPGAQTILLQEPQSNRPESVAGAGRPSVPTWMRHSPLRSLE